MSIATVRLYSKALDRLITYSAIIPEAPGPFPVLLQLHGMQGDHMAWLVSTNIARYARTSPFLILMPSGENAWWYDRAPGLQMEAMLMQDLREHVLRTYQVRTGKWAVGGLSMGGFGAMRLALKYPGQFGSVWAHSGDYPTGSELGLERPERDDADILALADRLAGAGTERPVISFDCGTDDKFLASNRRLHHHLEELSIPHQFYEHPGDHSWDYWDEHIQEALRQHAAVLG